MRKAGLKRDKPQITQIGTDCFYPRIAANCNCVKSLVKIRDISGLSDPFSPPLGEPEGASLTANCTNCTNAQSVAGHRIPMTFLTTDCTD